MDIKEQKIIRKSTTPNYKVEHFKKPAKKTIKKEEGRPKYRTVETFDDEGERHLVKVAIMKKKGKRGGTTKATTIMHPKSEKYTSEQYIDNIIGGKGKKYII